MRHPVLVGLVAGLFVLFLVFAAAGVYVLLGHAVSQESFREACEAQGGVLEEHEEGYVACFSPGSTIPLDV